MPLINIKTDSFKTEPGMFIKPANLDQQEHLKYLASIDDLINGNTQYFITNGNWSMYDLLIRLVDKIVSPVEVFLTFYSMTELSARILAKMVQEGKIRQLTIIYDRKSEIRYPNVHQILQGIARMKPVHIHAKLMLVRSIDTNNHITVLGSANWTRNPRIECGIYDTNPAHANLFIEWFQQHFTHDHTNA